jgi:hypothetical protein
MTHAQRFLVSVLRHGTQATVKVFTGGTTCPCMTSRGSEAPAYSAEWHRRNPTATDCAGKGTINATQSTDTIKTLPIEATAIGDIVRTSGIIVDIGEIKAGDVALYGGVKISDGTNYSFDGLKDWNEITVNSRVYAAKKVIRIPMGDTVITAALCRRVS